MDKLRIGTLVGGKDAVRVIPQLIPMVLNLSASLLADYRRDKPGRHGKESWRRSGRTRCYYFLPFLFGNP